jgi:hypothetical protein
MLGAAPAGRLVGEEAAAAVEEVEEDEEPADVLRVLVSESDPPEFLALDSPHKRSSYIGRKAYLLRDQKKERQKVVFIESQQMCRIFS